MSTASELREQIASSPDDLDVRRRYADVVARTDKPHAIFIRTQLERWDYYQRVGQRDDTYMAFRDREDELVAQHGSTWSAHVTKFGSDPMFMRGCVEHLRMDGATLLAKGDALYRAAPIRHLQLDNVKSCIAQLMASRLLAHLVSLDLHNCQLDDDDAAHLATAPHLAKLAWLDLAGNQLTVVGMESLAAADHLASCAYINLERNPEPSPVEQFGIDAHSGDIVAESFGLPAIGAYFEGRYGDRAWLRAPSRLPSYPLLIDDL